MAQTFNHIHFVGGEKGGVGKSFMARALCQYFQEHKHQKFALVEADSQINDVGRVYHQHAQRSATICLSDHPERATEPDTIFNLAEKTPVLVNLPSNTMYALERWMEHSNIWEFFETKTGKSRLTKWFVSDGCVESIEQLHHSIHQFNHRIPHVVVLNEGRLNGLNFDYLYEDTAFQEICEAPNCVTIIRLPQLESKHQYWIDKQRTTLAQARDIIQKDQGILARQRIKTFLDTCYGQIDTALKALNQHNLKSHTKTKPLAPESPSKTQHQPSNDVKSKPDSTPTRAAAGGDG